MRHYVPAIDGLRAVAVLGVVLFHFFPKEIPGGFVGVDVFFAISGYLVTRIIQTSIEAGQFSFKEFYERRIRRLLPALLTVLLVTTLAAFFTLLEPEIATYGRHLFSGTFFFSNLQFFSEAGYFDKASESKALLHLWSLSLEEQFYFVWPMILLLIFRFRTRMSGRFTLWSLIGLCLISLALSIHYTANFQKLAFFNLPFRLWELAAGGLLSFTESQIRSSKIYQHPSSRLIAPFGLITILVTYFAFSKDTLFPGLAALAPIIGTLCILLESRRTDGVSRWLGHHWLTYVGKVSYPFYLWHWPIFSISYVAYDSHPPAVYSVALMLLSFVLAVLTYEFIEKKPSSSVLKSTRWLLVANFSLGLFGLTFGTSTFQNVRPDYLRKVDLTLASKSAFLDAHQGKRPTGFCTSGEFASLELCRLAKESAPPTIALIGDSHAHHWFPGIANNVPTSENLLLLAKSGTPPLFGLKSRRSPDSDLDQELEFIANSKSIKLVILAGFWSNYFEPNGTLVSGYQYKNVVYSATEPNISESELLTRHLAESIDMLRKADKTVVFLYDSPALSFDLETCLPRPFREPSITCSYKKSDEIEKQKNYRERFAQVLANRSVRIGDPLPTLCPNDQCPIQVGDDFLYSDSHHFSVWGSDYVASRMKSLWMTP